MIRPLGLARHSFPGRPSPIRPLHGPRVNLRLPDARGRDAMTFASRRNPRAQNRPRRPDPVLEPDQRRDAPRRRDPGGDAREAHAVRRTRPAKKGVQILCLQEIFNGPYFCPSQDTRWYDAAEPVPGPTIESASADREEVRDGDRRAGLRARAGRRLLQHRGGDRRRRQVPRQVPQEPHPADVGVLGEVLLQAGQPRLPGVPDRVRRRSACTSATTATSPRARACSA